MGEDRVLIHASWRVVYELLSIPRQSIPCRRRDVSHQFHVRLLWIELIDVRGRRVGGWWGQASGSRFWTILICGRLPAERNTYLGPSRPRKVKPYRVSATITRQAACQPSQSCNRGQKSANHHSYYYLVAVNSFNMAEISDSAPSIIIEDTPKSVPLLLENPKSPTGLSGPSKVV